eukprot:m.450553 g.450553  ORF g.450553 m.450553 type:complete len:580 (+) comp21513_c0_seq1:170-1909(+)
MQSSVIIERLFMAIGATLLVGSALQYRVSTSVDEDGYEARLLLSRRVSHLRADQFVPTGPWRGEDGRGIESLLGRVCLTYNSEYFPFPILSNCTWSKDQHFNYSGNGTISVAVNNRQLCLAETTSSKYLLDVEVGMHLLREASRSADDPSASLALSLRQQQQKLHAQFRPRGAMLNPGMEERVALDAAVPRGNSTLPEHTVVLTRCNSSDPFQQWNYTRITGRFKRFGALVNGGSTWCLTRNAHVGDVSTATAARTERPVIVQRCDGTGVVERVHHGRGKDEERSPASTDTLACDQAWYLPKQLQRYHDANAVPMPLPWEVHGTTITSKVARPTHHMGKKRRRRRTTTADPTSTHSRAGKILCWVLTYPDAHDTKAVAVNRTWGARCDFLLFVTSETPRNGLPSVVVDLHGPEARDKIWNKTKNAWKYVFEHYHDKADWFVKADDDTYINMDNLRQFLLPKNASQPTYYGRPFKHAGHLSHSYYSGGSGIVFSRATLRQLYRAVNNTGGRVVLTATSVWKRTCFWCECLLLGIVILCRAVLNRHVWLEKLRFRKTVHKRPLIHCTDVHYDSYLCDYILL